jgi:hypothetical protein
MTREQMNIIINIQAMQKQVYGRADSTENFEGYRIDALREIQYDMIEQWNMDLKVKKMRLIIDEQSVGIYIGPDEFVRWTTDEVHDDPEVALIMAKAVELFYTNPKQLLQL